MELDSMSAFCRPHSIKRGFLGIRGAVAGAEFGGFDSEVDIDGVDIEPSELGPDASAIDQDSGRIRLDLSPELWLYVCTPSAASGANR